MTEDELKPCPFCGARRHTIKRNGPRSIFVECAKCTARGQTMLTEKEAKEVWNRRVMPAPFMSG